MASKQDDLDKEKKSKGAGNFVWFILIIITFVVLFFSFFYSSYYSGETAGDALSSGLGSIESEFSSWS